MSSREVHGKSDSSEEKLNRIDEKQPQEVQ